MVQLLDDIRSELAPAPLVEVGEAAARRSLRGQIARLEGQLAECCVPGGQRVQPVRGAPLAAGPRLLDLSDLEALRDELAERVRRARIEVARVEDGRAAARLQLERMRLEPGAHRYARITSAALGDPGCGAWHVRPRLGILGMLMGWWQVKLSSGCPLATPHPRRPRRPGPERVWP